MITVASNAQGLYSFIMDENKTKRQFLGVMFECCHVYGRIYKNKTGTYYEGKCPRCLKVVRIAIGEGGTSTRFFKAY